MKIFSSLFISAVLFAPLAANAASFDCHHAKYTLEVLICADPAMSSLDDEVGQRYAQIRSLVPEGSKDSTRLLHEQRQFLKERSQFCPISDKSELSESETNSIITCLKGHYSFRLDVLRKQLANLADHTPEQFPVNAAAITPSAGASNNIITPIHQQPTKIPTVSDFRHPHETQSPIKAPDTVAPKVLSRPIPVTSSKESSSGAGSFIGFLILMWILSKVFGTKKKKPTPKLNATPITVTVSTSGTKPISKKDARWILPGEIVTIANHSISAGYIYVGTSLSADVGAGNYGASHTQEQALINPSLPVAARDPDTAGANMGYWPSYSEISPVCRLAYVQWLAGGKCDPAISIGYVFLYFYGLERRLVTDAQSTDEILSLIQEIERLRSVYSSNRSFDGYSQRLLEAAFFLLSCRKSKNLEIILPQIENDAPSERMVQLAALAYRTKDNVPLSFEWALVGYFLASGTQYKVAVKRARPVFIALMRKRFEKKWPQGYISRYRKDAHAFTYSFKGASRYMYVSDLMKTAGMDKLLDPQSFIWTALVKMAEQVEEDLAGYARAIGRNPALANSPEAILLLPAEIADERLNTVERPLSQWLGTIANPIGRIKLTDLVKRIIGAETDSIDQRKLRSISEILARLGYGFEPDPDFGRPNTKAGETGIIFDARDLKNIRTPASTNYSFATAIATLVAGIGGASETGLGEAEIRWLGWIQKTLNLTAHEDRRLRAYLEWLAIQRLTMGQIKRALSEVPAHQRDTIARFAAAVAAADGVIEKSEVAFLEKVYDELGVERSKLYGTLHDMAAEQAIPATMPVTVESSSIRANAGYKIKPAPVLNIEKNTNQTLNRKRIDQILEETKQVSGILTSVFNEHEISQTTTPNAMKTEEPTNSRFAGLDANHTLLATRLITQPEWKRDAFEEIAREFRLMPDGALEVINEWAFEHFDEPFIEDGDTIEINRALVE